MSFERIKADLYFRQDEGGEVEVKVELVPGSAYTLLRQGVDRAAVVAICGPVVAAAVDAFYGEDGGEAEVKSKESSKPKKDSKAKGKE